MSGRTGNKRTVAAWLCGMTTGRVAAIHRTLIEAPIQIVTIPTRNPLHYQKLTLTLRER